MLQHADSAAHLHLWDEDVVQQHQEALHHRVLSCRSLNLSLRQCAPHYDGIIEVFYIKYRLWHLLRQVLTNGAEK